jgi:hypothetical protein
VPRQPPLVLRESIDLRSQRARCLVSSLFFRGMVILRGRAVVAAAGGWRLYRTRVSLRSGYGFLGSPTQLRSPEMKNPNSVVSASSAESFAQHRLAPPGHSRIADRMGRDSTIFRRNPF